MKKDGFTLAEMMVVIAIFLTIATISFANYRSIDAGLEFERNVADLTRALRRARTLSIGSYYLEEYGEEFRGVFGVKIEQDHFILYADLDNSFTYTSGTDSVIERGYFGERVEAQTGEIAFRPPDVIVYFEGEEREKGSSSKEIQLSFNQGERIRTVSINSLGIVEIN